MILPYYCSDLEHWPWISPITAHSSDVENLSWFSRITAHRTSRRWRLARSTATRYGAPWWSSATVTWWWIRPSHSLTFRGRRAPRRPRASRQHRTLVTVPSSTRWPDTHSNTSSPPRGVITATADMANKELLTRTGGHLVSAQCTFVFILSSILPLFLHVSCKNTIYSDIVFHKLLLFSIVLKCIYAVEVKTISKGHACERDACYGSMLVYSLSV